MAKKNQEPRVLYLQFKDGPLAGKKFQAPNPPWDKIKTGMPEWAVYRFNGTEYEVEFVGEMARLWIDPVNRTGRLGP